MQAFTHHRGLVAPLPRPNIDTDAIIPKQFLKLLGREGLGRFLFDEWRYLDIGDPAMGADVVRPLNPQFVLNQAHYRQATVLLAGANFGCGSSREHAVWAVMDHGLRAVIAPSFADIFHNNALKNGLLPIALPEAAIHLLTGLALNSSLWVDIDLGQQSLSAADQRWHFDIGAFAKTCLLEGLDEIGLSLRYKDQIAEFEQRRRAQEPWVF